MVGEVATLTHLRKQHQLYSIIQNGIFINYKSRNDPVERGALVSISSLVRAEAAEIFNSFGGDVGTEHDDDSSQRIFSCSHIQINLRVLLGFFTGRLSTLNRQENYTHYSHKLL